jgi:rsbT co-antagonist protein RsbR
LLRELVQALKSGKVNDVKATEWNATRVLLSDFSRSRAMLGFTPSETATFIFSMKEPLFSLLREEAKNDAQRLANQTWTITKSNLDDHEVSRQSRTLYSLPEEPR